MTQAHDVTMRPMEPSLASQFATQIEQPGTPRSTQTHIVLPRQVVDYALVYLADRKGPGDLIYQELAKAIAALSSPQTSQMR